MPVCSECNYLGFFDILRCPHCDREICESCIKNNRDCCPNCGTYLWRILKAK